MTGLKEAMNEILQYLRNHGERLDIEIAEATGISLPKMHQHLSELASRKQILACHSIKFVQGKKVEGIICRLVGYIPSTKAGKKAKSQMPLS